MKFVLSTLALIVIGTAAHADVPPGPDAINGAFVRLLAHDAAATTVAATTASDADRMFERWVNRVARNEMSSAEAGFAHMLARVDEAPQPQVVRGEPDPVAVMIVHALESQQLDAQVLARRD